MTAGMRAPGWLRSFGVGLALLSGLAALALLLLPLMLVLLMVLFNNTAHGVLVLLGVLLGWLRDVLLGGGTGGLQPFQAIAFHPAEIAAGSLGRAAPCAAGLLILIGGRPVRGSWWWWIVLLWSIAAAFGGTAAAVALLPGLVVAVLFALGIAAPRF